MPAILAALGSRSPDEPRTLEVVESQPVEELLLRLEDPRVTTGDGKRRVTAMARLTYFPAASTDRWIESNRFRFNVPLGPIETEELRWYLEQYYIWPVGLFRDRAKQIEAQLPKWGETLYTATTASDSAKAPLSAWQNVASDTDRRFSIEVDRRAPDGSTAERKAETEEAATLLLALPWELLHDGDTYLFQGRNAARVRRRFPFDLVGTVLRAEGLTPKADDAGESQAEISALVEAVNRHARALVLIAREVARRGVNATTERLDQVMTDLDKRYPNDRENSLYASLELSLRRLPEDVQKQVQALAVFHGGVNLLALGLMWTEIDTGQTDANSSDVASRLSQSFQDASQFAQELVGVGLGELVHQYHLRVDPALPAYQRETLSAGDIEVLQDKWGEAMEQLIAFLYQQRSQDTQLAAELTRLELMNLTAFLRWAVDHKPPSHVIDWTGRIEQLVKAVGVQRVWQLGNVQSV
jgi:hypothetical protein